VNGETLTWAKGRSLASLTKNNVTTEYTYDYYGLRTTKTGALYHYADGVMLGMSLTVGQSVFDIGFYYDVDRQPFGFVVNGVAGSPHLEKRT